MILTNLIRFRESLGFNQKEFAEELGIKQTTYNGYEKGKSDPGIDFLVMVSLKYNVSLDYLAGKDGNPIPIGKRKLLSLDDREGIRTKLIDDFDTMSETGQDERLNSIIESYDSMNEEGKTKLSEQARDYSSLPRYQKETQFQLDSETA